MDWQNLPTLNSLRALSALAETGSLAEAAKRLNVTYPAVSQQVKALEAYLDTTLIVREGRGIRLTNEGSMLADHLATGFSAISHGVEKIRRNDTSRPVQITTSPAFAVEWLMPRMSEFQNRHPDIMLMLNPTVDVVDLKPGGVDLAFRYCGRDRLPAGASPVLVTDMVVVGSSDLLGQVALDGQSSLHDLPWLQELGTNEVHSWFERRGIKIETPILITQMPGSLIMEAVRRGDGITYTAKAFFQNDINAGLVRVLHCEPANGVYHLEMNSNSQRSAVRAFSNWALSQAKTTTT